MQCILLCCLTFTGIFFTRLRVCSYCYLYIHRSQSHTKRRHIIKIRLNCVVVMWIKAFIIMEMDWSWEKTIFFVSGTIGQGTAHFPLRLRVSLVMGHMGYNCNLYCMTSWPQRCVWSSTCFVLLGHYTQYCLHVFEKSYVGINETALV